jgi:hypothetical protein
MVLKGVAEAIEHCTQTQVEITVTTAIYALEMTASAKASRAITTVPLYPGLLQEALGS